MSAMSSQKAASRSTPTQLVRWLYGTIEAIVLLLVCWAPWPFNSIPPVFELILFVGVAVLLVLWSLAILIEWRFRWKRCLAALCLVGLIVVGLIQLAPLPPNVLRILSPAEVRLVQQLKPATHEVFAPGEQPVEVAHAAGATLSLYPGGTRLALLHLLAVFLLFAVVRNTFASKESLRRLGLACLVNGCDVTLFALVQFFTSQRHVVYWKYDTAGMVFGPFINRNYFAFFVNVCVCLTAGLLAGYWLRRRSDELSWRSVLQHTPSLWLGVACLFMLFGLAFCLSRGGLGALLISGLTVTAVFWANSKRRSWVGLVGVAAVLVGFILVAWYALPAVEGRLAPLRHEKLQDARFPVWANGLKVGRDFPFAGAGYGTFIFLEGSQRSPGVGPGEKVVYPYADNDYVEAIAEGGALRLLVSVAAILVVFMLGVRAYRRYQGHPAGAWVLGALAGFTAVAVHSFFDFGLHIPAIAFLTTVLAAHLAASGAQRTPDNLPEEYSIRLLGLGPVLAAVTLLLLAVTLTAEGWRLSQAERFRKAAEYRDVYLSTESHARQVVYLETAVRYSPDDAALRLALADAHLWEAEEGTAISLATGSAVGVAGRAPAALHRADAARQLLIARDLCPVMLQPHARLAALADEFASADSPRNYLMRTTLLSPIDPELWYLRGNAEQNAGDLDAAWQSWRRSLELSDQYLPDILKRLGDKPDAEAVAERLLPDNAEMLVQASQLLYPDEKDQKAREPLLHRAVELLKQRVGTQAKDLHLRGQMQDGLGERTEAIASYRLALTVGRRNGVTNWRNCCTATAG